MKILKWKDRGSGLITWGRSQENLGRKHNYGQESHIEGPPILRGHRKRIWPAIEPGL